MASNDNNKKKKINMTAVFDYCFASKFVNFLRENYPLDYLTLQLSKQ